MCGMDGRDRINLAGMRFYGYHGCLPEERQHGQYFYVDVSMLLPLAAAGRMTSIRR